MQSERDDLIIVYTSTNTKYLCITPACKSSCSRQAQNSHITPAATVAVAPFRQKRKRTFLFSHTAHQHIANSVMVAAATEIVKMQLAKYCTNTPHRIERAYQRQYMMMMWRRRRIGKYYQKWKFSLNLPLEHMRAYIFSYSTTVVCSTLSWS